MKKFRLKGLVHPGRVNVLRFGTVELANVSDEIAEQIWKQGCPFLEPVPEFRAEFFPNQIPIEVKPIILEEREAAPATVKPVMGTRKKPKTK